MTDIYPIFGFKVGVVVAQPQSCRQTNRNRSPNVSTLIYALPLILTLVNHNKSE